MIPNEDPHNPDTLLTYAEMARKLNLKLGTFRRLVRRLKIPHVNMSHQLKRFHYPTVLKFLQTRKPSP